MGLQLAKYTPDVHGTVVNRLAYTITESVPE